MCSEAGMRAAQPTKWQQVVNTVKTRIQGRDHERKLITNSAYLLVWISALIKCREDG